MKISLILIVTFLSLSVNASEGDHAQQTTRKEADKESRSARKDWLKIQDFKKLPLSNGISEEFSISVPQNAVGLQLNISGLADSVCFVEEATNPSDKKIISSNPNGIVISESDKTNKLGQYLSPNRAGIYTMPPGPGTVLIPNNEKVSLVPGAWKFKVGCLSNDKPQEGTVDVRAIIKTADSVPQKGQVKLYIHLAGVNGWKKDSLLEDKEFQTALEEVRRIYEKVNIDVEIAGVSDIDPKLQEIRNNADFSEALNSSVEQDGIHVYIVRSLPVPRAAGLSTGVAGPSHGPSTQKGGVFVTVGPMFRIFGGKGLGASLSHEMGHYLGLSHTMENWFGMTQYDQLSDTIEGADRSNVMGPDSENASFSPEQRKVIFRHPLVEWK